MSKLDLDLLLLQLRLYEKRLESERRKHPRKSIDYYGHTENLVAVEDTISLVEIHIDERQEHEN